jgi:hypothetical protein
VASSDRSVPTIPAFIGHLAFRRDLGVGDERAHLVQVARPDAARIEQVTHQRRHVTPKRRSVSPLTIERRTSPSETRAR